MFCPDCGHRQVSDDMRFCSQCGLPLDSVLDLVASGEQLKREKRQITGIGLMMATVLLLLNFVIVFGAVTLPHLANPAFFWIWLSFVIAALTTSGVGLANLVRGGYFKSLNEREKRLALMKERQKSIDDRSTGRIDEASSTERASITEGTTRQLGGKNG